MSLFAKTGAVLGRWRLGRDSGSRAGRQDYGKIQKAEPDGGKAFVLEARMKLERAQGRPQHVRLRQTRRRR